MSQGYGFGFKNPKKALEALNDSEKYLLLDCSEIVGVPLDSMLGVDEIYERFREESSQYNVMVVVRSNYLLHDTENNNGKDKVIENYYRYKNLDAPRFMVFVLKTNEGTKVTLQMYY